MNPDRNWTSHTETEPAIERQNQPYRYRTSPTDTEPALTETEPTPTTAGKHCAHAHLLLHPWPLWNTQGCIPLCCALLTWRRQRCPPPPSSGRTPCLGGAVETRCVKRLIVKRNYGCRFLFKEHSVRLFTFVHGDSAKFQWIIKKKNLSYFSCKHTNLTFVFVCLWTLD